MNGQARIWTLENSFADALQAGVRSIPEDENPMPESLHQELSNLRRLAEKYSTISKFEKHCILAKPAFSSSTNISTL